VLDGDVSSTDLMSASVLQRYCTGITLVLHKCHLSISLVSIEIADFAGNGAFGREGDMAAVTGGGVTVGCITVVAYCVALFLVYGCVVGGVVGLRASCVWFLLSWSDGADMVGDEAWVYCMRN
jgi:hypothetical protein